jgi:hypothetical protein
LTPSVTQMAFIDKLAQNQWTVNAEILLVISKTKFTAQLSIPASRV